MGVTLRDVARAAGVSPATASRALSSSGTVAAGRRELVLRAARELGYRPNPTARALATGRSGHLGLVVPDLENPFFAAIAKGVQARARDAGRAVLVADTDEDGALEAELVQQLGESVRGVIVCSPRMSARALERCSSAGGVVLVNREAPGMPSVTFDTRHGVRQALAHLHALGHRTVAYVGGPASSWSDGERRGALQDVEGLEVVDLGSHRPVPAGGVAAADLALASGATAVFCFNDLLAIGVLGRLRARGARVPEEMSVVSFDDIPAARLVAPSLTTVSVPLARAGREAVDLVLARTGTSGPDAGAPPAAQRRLPAELVVRDSTSPSRGERDVPWKETA